MRFDFQSYPPASEITVTFNYICSGCGKSITRVSLGIDVCMPLPPPGWVNVTCNKWESFWLCETHREAVMEKVAEVLNQQGESQGERING